MNPDYNLVLSGGGVRGYAHIGVLKALYEKKISIRAISGTSAGAMIGAFICDGFHPAEMEELISRQSPKLSLNYLGIKASILSFNSVSDLLRKNLRSKTFEELKLPLHVSVTNLNNGKQEIIRTGNLVEALIAASAIPILFPAVIINDIPYADGGISNNLPANAFAGESTSLIGVHVNPVAEYHHKTGLFNGVDRTLHLILRSNILGSMDDCDVFIEPPALCTYHLFETKKTSEIIKIGYDYAKSLEF